MMNEDRLQAITNVMTLKSIEKGGCIINEGEIGSHFYISHQGNFEVVKGDQKLTTFGPGIVFGELAVLHKSRRFASVKATEDSKVWTLSRKLFQQIIISTNRRDRKINKHIQKQADFLNSISTFSHMPIEKLESISSILKCESFTTGTKILQLDDLEDKLYIIYSGSVEILTVDDSGTGQVMAILYQGQYFGKPILTPQTCVIACQPGVTCLAVDRM